MEIQYFGANCIRIATKKAAIIIDDNLADLGLKTVTKPDDISLFTGAHVSPSKARLVIDQPGEYEVSDVSIQGVPARAHIDDNNQQSTTMYRIVTEDMHIVVTGHVYPELNDTQLERLGMVDILCIPVGNNGYTLDGLGALQLVKKIEPKLVIPTHYGDKEIKYPVEQHSLEEALKGLAMEPKEALSKLKIKPGDLPETTQLVTLERQ
jgi:L-ascorbate metabolism protein UlaG (beta-lactamase superfamily)